MRLEKNMQKLDHDWIASMREDGCTWRQIASVIDYASGPDSLRRTHNGWLARRRKVEPVGATVSTPDAQQLEDAPFVEGTLTEDDVRRILSLDDLLDFFKVDRAAWQVRDFRVNKWEQGSKVGGKVIITPLYQVRANLVRSFEDQASALGQLWADTIADIYQHAPPAPPAPVGVRGSPLYAGTPCMLELAIMDPHIGMLAWRPEAGESYDSDIAVRDYAQAVDELLQVADLYPIESILFIAGNDFLHVDGPGMGGQRGGATTAGTPQDVDSRLAKMFTTARRALVSAIDRARLVAPVDVLFVPGNHDAQQTYRMAEVVSAWYRNDPDVHIIYGPGKRYFYRYGSNAFMLTHGEEYRRMRENLPLIFATECPDETWAGATHKEIHTGHFHKKMEGRYTPTSDVDETRGIRTRALPSIAAADAWHTTEGYKHRRAATALVFRKSGGVAGIHEVYP